MTGKQKVETDIDRLLKFLVENGETSTKEVEEKLEVSSDLLELWVRALEKSGFIEKKFTTLKGTVLAPKKEDIKESRKDTDKTSKQEKQLKELEKARKHLLELEKVFEQEENLLSHLEELNDEITKDRELIEEQIKDVEVKPEIEEILEKADEKAGKNTEIEEQAEKVHKRKEIILKYIDSVDKVRENMKKKLSSETCCNICGKDFETVTGMKIHRTKVHGKDKGKEEKEDSSEEKTDD